MSLFDKLVHEALRNRAEFTPLRIVVEKELLHHDILREMSAAGFLETLTFIGGTCLRSCYGASRLSEDLDFTGGLNFRRAMLKGLGETLVDKLGKKYGLCISVGEPEKETGNVDTWKLKVITRPEKKMFPAQRINIDVCMVPSYDRKPVMLRNSYGVEMGTSGLILQAESREEILADKIIALAKRPNRIKNRDLWDIVWLKQQGVELIPEMVMIKLNDRKIRTDEFIQELLERVIKLGKDPGLYTHFIQEMKRFLPVLVVNETVENPAYWSFLTDLIHHECNVLKRAVLKLAEK
jgi:predicted nucleotidyltransferase component of viral defense system